MAKGSLREGSCPYERHYREIRATAPPEQLLDFQLKEGWEPLCRFLGKDVPDVSAPHVNEAAEYARHIRKSRNNALKRLAKKLFLPCFIHSPNHFITVFNVLVY